MYRLVIITSTTRSIYPSVNRPLSFLPCLSVHPLQLLVNGHLVISDSTGVSPTSENIPFSNIISDILLFLSCPFVDLAVVHYSSRAKIFWLTLTIGFDRGHLKGQAMQWTRLPMWKSSSSDTKYYTSVSMSLIRLIPLGGLVCIWCVSVLNGVAVA